MSTTIPSTKSESPLSSLDQCDDFVGGRYRKGKYSKGHAKPALKALKPYSDDLFAEFLPEKVGLVVSGPGVRV